MKIDLSGHIALVGGSTSGIGWAIARMLADAGAEVVLIGRNAERLAQRQEELQSRSLRPHHAIVADYDSSSAATSIASALQQANLQPDIFINNVAGPPPGAVLSSTADDFRRALDRLLLVAHQLLPYLLPHMQRQRWGRIINIISTSVRQPIEGLGVSNTIRAATAAWAKTLSLELAPYGITVNNILPGATRTERLLHIIRARAQQSGQSEELIEQQMKAEIPLQRFAEPEEIAALAVFLCSDYAAYITGESIRVDGGRTRCL